MSCHTKTLESNLIHFQEEMAHFLKTFFVKIVIKKTHVLNLMYFQGELFHFFLKNKALRSESVN